MDESFLREVLNRVKNFTDDMEKIGVRVIHNHSVGRLIRIELDIKPIDDEPIKGGDPDDKKTDTQS
jgi:hypothetical protein